MCYLLEWSGMVWYVLVAQGQLVRVSTGLIVCQLVWVHYI